MGITSAIFKQFGNTPVSMHKLNKLLIIGEIINPASKVVQIRAALVPVPSPDKWGGLRQEGHPA